MYGLGMFSIMGCKYSVSMGSAPFLSSSYSRVVPLRLDNALGGTGEPQKSQCL